MWVSYRPSFPGVLRISLWLCSVVLSPVGCVLLCCCRSVVFCCVVACRLCCVVLSPVDCVLLSCRRSIVLSLVGCVVASRLCYVVAGRLCCCRYIDQRLDNAFLCREHVLSSTQNASVTGQKAFPCREHVLRSTRNSSVTGQHQYSDTQGCCTWHLARLYFSGSDMQWIIILYKKKLFYKIKSTSNEKKL